jgi:hypothetical protein
MLVLNILGEQISMGTKWSGPNSRRAYDEPGEGTLGNQKLKKLGWSRVEDPA